MGSEELENLLKLHPELLSILNNIQKTKEILDNNLGPKIIGLISGNEEDRLFLEERFNQTKIFGAGSKIVSVREETRKGNFLGTLLFYKKLKEFDYLNMLLKDKTVLCGMVFGKGERLSPITHAFDNMKPSMPTFNSIKVSDRIIQETTIESALRFFSLVSSYLESKGFSGILDKWGDEIQIPGREFSYQKNDSFKEYDIIKMVSEQTVNPDNAKEKDWVGYDEDNNMTMQIPRRPIEKFQELAEKGLVKVKNRNYVCGISLGPVAISYRLLDISLEVFKDELETKGVYFDFDPYFLMALTLANKQNGRIEWEKARDNGINKLDEMMIKNKYGFDFFSKVKSIIDIYEKNYLKKLIVKVVDLDNLYWADIGQHKSMRETFMSLKENTREGFISRQIAQIPHEKDINGNIIVNSVIGKNVSITNSVIINSRINKGMINDSVIIDCHYHHADINNSFTVSDRVFKIKSHKNSGSIRSLSNRELIIPESSRHVTIILPEGSFSFTVEEKHDLRNEQNMAFPVNNNKYSFRELYDLVSKHQRKELNEKREKLEKEILDIISLAENNI